MPIEESWAMIRYEYGDVSWDTAGGEWYNDDRWDCITDGIDHEEICSNDDEVIAAKEKYDCFYILLQGVSFEFDSPSDTPEYGFDPGAQWIEYDSLMILPTQDKVEVKDVSGR